MKRIKRIIHMHDDRAAQTQLNGNGFGGRDPTPSPCSFTQTSGPAVKQNGTPAKPRGQKKPFAHVDLNSIAIWLFLITVAIASLLAAFQLWAKVHPH